MKFLKPCLAYGCGVLTTASYCDEHLEFRRKAYGPDWQRRSREMRVRIGHCQCDGCPKHNGPCQEISRLELDHEIPVVLGGTIKTANRVLCHRCNASKGDKILQ